MSIVSIEKCDDYEIENVYQALKKAIENSNIPTIKDKTILFFSNI